MSSVPNPDDFIEIEMEAIAEVLAEALRDGDRQVVRGIQRFGATNWTVVMTPGQIVGTLIRMHAEGREWCVIDSNSGHREMYSDEKEFWRYLQGDLKTGIDYLKSLYEWGLLDVRLPEHLDILVDHAMKGDLNSNDRRSLRGLGDDHRDLINGLNTDPDSSQSDKQNVLTALKNDHQNWVAIRLHPDAWEEYLDEMEHGYDERVHTHALGNIFGISVQGKGKSIYRPIRRIVEKFSGETVPLDELREEFTRVGRGDRFDFWVRHEQQLRDPMRLISFDDGLAEVAIDRDRAAHRALQLINERAQERYRSGYRSS